MQALKKLCQNVIRINDIFSKLLNQLYNTKEFQDFVVDLNTNKQLYEDGVNNVGIRLDSMAGGYTQYTIEIKQQKGQPTDRVTLKDSGDFYKTFRVEVSGDVLDIVANTFLYADFSFEKYIIDGFGTGEQQVIGLTDENLGLVSEKIAGVIIDQLRDAILPSLAVA